MKKLNVGDKVWVLLYSHCDNLNGKNLECHLYKNGKCLNKKRCEYKNSMFVSPSVVTSDNIDMLEEDYGVFCFKTREEVAEAINKNNIKVIGWVET